jgi:RNA polymerase sigma factor (sigma-70 family)
MATTKPGGLIGRLRTAALLSEGAGTTDGSLLERFVTGRDAAAFELLVRRHGPMVLGVCRRVTGHAQDAEDAFQATFLVLARRAASVRPRAAVGNWLYGVAYRTARRAKALAARRRAREKQVNDMPHPATQPPADAFQLEPLLDEELSRLPDKYRLPVVLCELEGQARKTVARQLGIPEGTLSSRLATARRLLAGRLARRGLAPSVTGLAALSRLEASACVPPALTTSTVRAATRLGAGPAAGGLISAEVAALTEGVLKSMLLTKLKVAAAVVLLAGAVVIGTGVGAPEGIRAGQAGATSAGPRTAGAAPATAAGGEAAKPDVQAKESVEQFLKALKGADVEGILQVSGVPFLQGAIIRKREDLKADFQRLLDRRDFSQDKTEVEMVSTLPEFEKALGKKLTEQTRKDLVEVLGEDHRLVLIAFPGDGTKPKAAKPKVAIAVRLRAGKATVVGIIDALQVPAGD